MKSLYNSYLKNKALFEIKRLGDGVCEIILDVHLTFCTINTIEYDEIDNRIILHVFELPQYDINYDFEDLELEDKITIIKALKAI